MSRLLASLVSLFAAVALIGAADPAPDHSLSVGVEDCYYAEAELPPYVQEVRVCPRP